MGLELTIEPQTLGSKAAAALDKELMSTGAFSIDQLMELAGLSVSQAGMVLPPSTSCTVSIQMSTASARLMDYSSIPRSSPKQWSPRLGRVRSWKQWFARHLPLFWHIESDALC